MAGKGDKPRQVHGPTWRNNYDAIFRKEPRKERLLLKIINDAVKAKAKENEHTSTN